MARPLRFRVSHEDWTGDRVRRELLQPLDANLGAAAADPRTAPPDGWSARRFEMDNGDLALFAFGDGVAYWVGNTETPKALWRTEKVGWGEVPMAVAKWAEDELLATLRERSPWLADYPHLAWFFLPVLMSKDGRETSREFLGERAAGFPDADREAALSFYEDFLATGALDGYRATMAGKLGTSERLDEVRMAATMAEFTAARLLAAAGYAFTPEVDVESGHTLDFRVRDGDREVLVEVTRPSPPRGRRANTPAAALRETAATKLEGQLAGRGGEVVLLVDCSSFPADEWRALLGERPAVGHEPAVVYRARPDGSAEGYEVGAVPLDLSAAVALP